jgi:Domain of unknown function (DUF4386)
VLRREANGEATAYQNFIIEKHDLLVAQAWMYALAAPLMLIFAVAVRRVLRKLDDGGYLSELFLVGTAAIAGLLVVAMAMQLAVAERAEGSAAEVVFTVGVHFVGVLIGLCGFIMGATAFAYAFCVFAYGVLPRWTAYLAVLALAVNVLSTAGVFFRTGPFCLEGGFSAWAPAVSTVLWYLGASIAILRMRDRADSPA